LTVTEKKKATNE